MAVVLTAPSPCHSAALQFETVGSCQTLLFVSGACFDDLHWSCISALGKSLFLQRVLD
jgi:hypothetical protein